MSDVNFSEVLLENLGRNTEVFFIEYSNEFMFETRLLQERYILPNVRQGGVSEFIEDEIRRICVSPRMGEKSIGDLFINGNPINIKTIDLGKKFHMPNLVSAKKAYDYLRNPKNKLYFLFIEYEKIGDMVLIKNETIKEIEELANTVIQAQGEGVIQLKSLSFKEHIGRTLWLEEFKVKMRDFIQRETKKWENRFMYYNL